jgi:hypothetical protein
MLQKPFDWMNRVTPDFVSYDYEQIMHVNMTFFPVDEAEDQLIDSFINESCMIDPIVDDCCFTCESSSKSV